MKTQAVHTILNSFLSFFVVSFWKMGLCLEEPGLSVVPNTSRKEKKEKASAWLYFYFFSQLLCSAQRSERVKTWKLSHFLEPFLSFPAFGTRCLRLRSNLRIARQMQLLHHRLFPSYWSYFSAFFLFIFYFWHLICGDESVLHSSVSVPESCVSSFLTLNVSQYFHSEAALPVSLSIRWRWSLFLSFKEKRIFTID